MSELLDDLKKGAQPTQKNFSKADYEGKLRTSTCPEERRVLQVGIWVSEKLDEIRQESLLLSKSWQSSQPHYLGVMAYLNSAAVFMSSLQVENKRKDNVVIGDEILGAKIQDSDFTPDEIITGLVDGGRFALALAMNASGEFVPGTVCSDIDYDFSGVSDLCSLGQYYNIVSTMWKEALHLDLQVEFKEKSAIFSLGDETGEMIATSEFRCMRVDNEIAMMAMQNGEFCDTVADVMVFRHGEGGELKASEATKDETSEYLFDSCFCSEASVESLLKVPLADRNEAFTIENVAKLFFAIKALSKEVVSIANKQSSVGVADVVPVYRVESLKAEALKILDVDESATERLIELLLFSDPNRDALWDRPLIAVGEKYFTIAFLPVLFGHPYHRVNSWLRSLDGSILKKKGDAFEKRVRSELAQVIQFSPVASSIRLVPHSVHIGEEELDLVVRIGNSIIIGELKCQMRPHDPFLQAQYCATLKEGADQLRRKIDHLQCRMDELLGHVDARGGQAGFKLIPCLVTNISWGCGYPAGGMPVIDLHILKTFIGGHHLHFLYHGKDGFEEAGVGAIYCSVGEAEDALQTFINNPPTVSYLKEFTDRVREDTPSVFGISGFSILRHVCIPLGGDNLSTDPPEWKFGN